MTRSFYGVYGVYGVCFSPRVESVSDSFGVSAAVNHGNPVNPGVGLR